MKTKRQHKAAAATPLTAFWDTSRIVRLCELPGAAGAGSTNSSIETRQVVWWAAGVEAVSSFSRLNSRLKRDGHLTPPIQGMQAGIGAA